MITIVFFNSMNCGALSPPQCCLFSFPLSGFILTSLFSRPSSVKSAAEKLVKLTDLTHKHPSVSVRVKEDGGLMAQKGCRHDILRSTAASCLIPVRSSLIIKLQSLLRTEAITIWSCLDGCYHGSLPSIAHDTSAAAIFIPNDSFLQQRRVSGGKMCVFSFNNRPRVT